MSTDVLPDLASSPLSDSSVCTSGVLEVVPVSAAGMNAWQALEGRLQHPCLMHSYTWTHYWLKHYGDLVPSRIAIGKQNGEIIGMTLLTAGVSQTDGPFPIQTLHFGTAGEPELDSVCVEYNRLLVSPEHRTTYVELLMNHVRDHERWECLKIDGMVADDANAIFRHTPAHETREVPCHFADLNAFRESEKSNKEPWRLFGESTKTNLRRAFRDLGELTVDWATTPDQALPFYEEMIAYHQERWKAAGEPGVFSSFRFTELHRDLIAELVPQGRAVLVRARQGDKVLGILYVLIEQNRLLYYQAGLPDHKSKLSLGCVTQYLTMLEGSRRGYEAFDFMAGDTLNKRVLSTDKNLVYWATWRRPSVKFRVLDGLRSLKSLLGRNG